jgi:protein transport protein SEC13
VSGGIDNLVKIWVYKFNKFDLQQDLTGHNDWVRDVAWSNNIGLLQDTIASCSEDQKVKIWKKDIAGNDWKEKTIELNVPVWKVSWS